MSDKNSEDPASKKFCEKEKHNLPMKPFGVTRVFHFSTLQTETLSTSALPELQKGT